MKVIISGDIGSFKTGQVLSDDAKIASYYRTCVNEGADKPTTMTDEDILACVYAHQDETMTPDDLDMVRIEQIESGRVPVDDTEPVTNDDANGKVESISAAREEMKRASEVADRFTAELNADIAEFISAKKTVNLKALQFKLKLETVFGKAMLAWPIPGSTKKGNDEKFGVGNNQPFDKYSRYVAGSGKKTVASSFYGDIIDRTVFGKDNAKRRAQIIDSGSTDAKVKATAPAEYKRLSTADRKVVLDQIDNDRTTAISLIGRAVELFQKENEVRDGLPLISFRYAADKDGNIHGRKVMVLTNKSDGVTEAMTIGMFKSINVAAATLLGGNLGDVLETLGATDEEEEEKDQDGVAVMTLDTFAAAAADVLNFLEVTEEDGGKLGLFYARLNKEGPDTDHELATYFKLKAQLELICSKPKFQERFAAFEMNEKAAAQIGKPKAA